MGPRRRDWKGRRRRRRRRWWWWWWWWWWSGLLRTDAFPLSLLPPTPGESLFPRAA